MWLISLKNAFLHGNDIRNHVTFDWRAVVASISAIVGVASLEEGRNKEHN